jgi:hypothetical protein
MQRLVAKQKTRVGLYKRIVMREVEPLSYDPRLFRKQRRLRRSIIFWARRPNSPRVSTGFEWLDKTVQHQQGEEITPVAFARADFLTRERGLPGESAAHGFASHACGFGRYRTRLASA